VKTGRSEDSCGAWRDHRFEGHGHHRVLADAFFAAQIFQIQMTKHGVLGVEQLLELLKNQKRCDASFLF